jgi:hypothetical protein
MDPKETTIPAVLLGVGVAILVGYGIWTAGAAGAGVVLAVVAIRLVIGIPLGIVACLLTASLMQASFGTLRGAILKLAAVFIFPTAFALLMPGLLAWLAAVVLYYFLLAFLFELEAMEVIVLVFVLSGVNIVAAFLVARVAAGLFAAG